MIRTIKANKLFALVPEQAAKDRISYMKIPIRRNLEYPDYSLKLLELMVLTACIRIVKATRMFEFGTFLGNTTLHMAMNSAPDAKIWTFDADEETLKGTLSEYSWRDDYPMEFWDTPMQNKILPLEGNSHNLTIMPAMAESMDLVLIDGDHTAKGVAIDTANARRLLRYNGCILWHDYKKEAPLVMEFLDNLSHGMPLIHIEDTSLVLFMGDCI